MSCQRKITVQTTEALPLGQQPFELVERKGLGHPDSICDAIMEAACRDLCREYHDRFGRVLHHNLDKALLVAGRTVPRLGAGGQIMEPIRIIFGDRATYECDGVRIPVGDIVENAARRWIQEHLRFVDPQRHIVFQNEIKPGSAELTDIFARQVIGANDTSVGVGYAPLSETEQLVLAAERFLNSPSFKQTFPETGEDVKIMGYRAGRHLALTVAVAFVDRFLRDPQAYFDKKDEVQMALGKFLSEKAGGLDSITAAVNTLDDPGRGESGIYLTVLGTSAEGADGGEVGRGNRVNGLIAFNRPASSEAVAGKNPVSHVGKIYGVLSQEIAAAIHREIAEVREATVWLCSRIGNPIDQPLVAAAQLILEPGVLPGKVESAVHEIIDRDLSQIQAFTSRLILGEFAVF